MNNIKALPGCFRGSRQLGQTIANLCIILYIRSKDALSGILCGSDENAVAVTFKVIVPKECWLWDKNSKIYLRFGDPCLGHWKENIGGFEMIRYNHYS